MAKIVILCICGMAMNTYKNYIDEKHISIFNLEDSIHFYFLLTLYLIVCLIFFFM